MFKKIHNVPKRLLFTFTLLVILLTAFTALAFAQGNVLTDPPQNYELTQGWYQGRETFYYDFGANTSATEDGQQVVPAPIYVLVTGFDAEGNPQVVEGQHNIVDVIPGDPGYSDLWQVTFVTVPEDYEANSITSAQQILDAGYEMTVPGVLVNCPLVPADSTLSEGGAPLVQGWYQGQEVYYFDFGQNTEATAPIYAFITGFDDSGAPVFVEGQHNVIDVIPGDAGYSAFWYVNLVMVPEGYEANTITSVEAVLASGYETVQPGLLVNCPVLRTAEAPAAEETTMEAPAAQETPTELPSTGGSSSVSLAWMALIAGGVLLAGAGLVLLLVLARKAGAN